MENPPVFLVKFNQPGGKPYKAEFRFQATLTQLLASDSGQGQESSPSGIPLFQKANGAFGVLLPVHHDVLQARS